uniref:Uncharacterized protein n=1 Tax=Arundo donax TaxID=35708 RepID=A0A0A9UJ40_ARUDO
MICFLWSGTLHVDELGSTHRTKQAYI